jgi:hypothetical protein
MSRNWSQIEAAALASKAAVASDNTLSTPPGFIQGFKIILNKDYTVDVGSGIANVGGRQVQLTSTHKLMLEDWVSPRASVPYHYYIYLSKEGKIYVDILSPTWSNQYYYWEQVNRGWRAIGKLFILNTDIIFASGTLEGRT